MLKLHLLGSPTITLNDHPVSGLASDKVLTLLCYLAIEHGEQRRDRLTTLFWGDMPEEKARGSLRSALYNLQKHIPNYIESTRKTVKLNRSRALWIDVEAFTNALASDPNAIDATTAALYRGPFLDGLGFRDAEGAETWLRQQRESLRLLAQSLLKQLVEQQVAAGAWAKGATTARRLLDIEPWHESAHYYLMLCLAREGDTAAAIQQFKLCERVLDEELGIEPLPRTVRLVERIKLARSAEFHPTLPADITPFVGRATDLARLEGLLSDPSCRLLTIVGTGGVGKTRLAIAAGRRQVGWYLNGVAFVSLAGLEATHGDLIASAIAAQIGLTISGNEKPLVQLLRYLENREMLLILDNLEHLMDAAVQVVEALLAGCADVSLLVTSRERLLLQQEWLFQVAGLAFPEWGRDADRPYGAVDLFEQTARRVRHDGSVSAEFETVAAICRLVEGLPLGVELAAALTATQSSETVLHNLRNHLDHIETHYRNIPPRHRSLRATFDYSWDLLQPDERALLAQLSTFRGGFNEPAMQAVTQAEPQTLQRLIVTSLVRPQADGRFDLHEMVRQFSAEKIETFSFLTVPAHAHCLYIASLLDSLAQTLIDPEHMRESQRIFATDIDNIRAAWRYAINHLLHDEISTMSNAYIMYMESTGIYSEGVEQFSRAVAKLRHETSLAGRHALSSVAWGLGWAKERIGQLDESEEAFELAVENARIVENGPNLIVILRQYTLLELARGAMSKARTLIEESVAIAKAEQDDYNYAASVTILAATLGRMGLHEEALQAINESIRLKQQGGNARDLAISLQNKGDILMRLGRPDEAQPLYEHVFAVCDEMNEVMGKIVSRKALGIIALERGKFETARGHFTYIREQSEPISPHMVMLADIRLATVDEAAGQLHAAREVYEDAIVFLTEAADHGNVAMVQALLGGVLLRQGVLDSAESKLRAAIATALDNQQPKIYLDAMLHLADVMAERNNLDFAGRLLSSVLVHDSAETQHIKQARTRLAQLGLTQTAPILLAEL